jgi:hypothetical protein
MYGGDYHYPQNELRSINILSELDNHNQCQDNSRLALSSSSFHSE